MAGKSGQTIGYHYLFTMLCGLWRGPVNELVELRVDDKTAWSGSLSGIAPIPVNKPELFGGEEKEGGIQGALRIFQGAGDQVLPGEAAVNIGTTGPVKKTVLPDVKASIGGLVSDLRGFVCIWYDGLITSMNPYPKPWKFRGRRSTAGWFNDDPWYPEKAIIYLEGGAIHAMNGAHIVYQCLTDPQWGSGKLPELIDENSFTLAANTLCAELFGLCFNWTRQEDVDTFIQVVLDHIGGALFNDPSTGKYVLRLIRDDYDPAAVPLYDADSGLLGVEEDDSASSEEAINEVVLTGHDPRTDKDFEVREHNIAAREAHGEIISQSVELKGIPTRALGQRVAKQRLRLHATGLKRLRVRLDRRAWQVTEGSVIRITSPRHNISNMILRVGEVDRGTLASGEIVLRTVEDIFGMPASSFVTPVESTWAPPTAEAVPAEDTRLIEAGYRDVLRRIGDADMAAVDGADAYIGQLARAPFATAYEYDLASKAGGETAFSVRRRGSFTGTATLAAALAPADTAISLAAVVDIDSDHVGEALLIGGELVRLDSYDDATASGVIARGVGDTIPQAHALGDRAWTVDDDLVSDQRTYVTGEDVSTKVLTRTASDVLTLAEAAPETVTLVGRQARPYPPGAVKVDGTSIFALGGQHAEPVLAWAHRDRLTQADQLVEHDAGSVGPEAGTTYTVRVKAADGTLLRTEAGIAATTWTYTAAMQGTDGAPTRVIFELEAVRDDLASWQAYNFSVTLSGGYGLAYGFNYGGAT